MTSDNHRKKGNVEAVLEYIIAGLFIIELNSVYSQGFNSYPNLWLSVLLVVLSFTKGTRIELPKLALSILIVYWLFCIVYLVANGGTNSAATSFAIRFLWIIPSVWLLFYRDRYNGKDLIDKISNIVVVVCLISLFFWLFGSIMGLIHPNCYVDAHWGSTYRYKSYFDLYFERQTTMVFGKRLIRNIGIFCEAPMYSTCIVFAIAAKMFVENHFINKSIIVLYITLFTTFSTTGIIIGIAMVVLKYLGKETKNRSESAVKLIMAPVIFITSAILINMAFGAKQQSDMYSFALRMGGLSYSFKQLINISVFGNGYGTSSEYVYRDFVGANISGLGSLIEQGGLWLLILYTIPLLFGIKNSIRNRNYNLTCIILILVMELVSTVIQFTDMFLVMIVFVLIQSYRNTKEINYL